MLSYICQMFCVVREFSTLRLRYQICHGIFKDKALCYIHHFFSSMPEDATTVRTGGGGLNHVHLASNVTACRDSTTMHFRHALSVCVISSVTLHVIVFGEVYTGVTGAP